MMGISYIILLAVLLHLSLAQQTRIIGGDETDEDRYPYTVALTKGTKRFFCGGTLIARDVVLTAGHCIGGNYEVAVGRHVLSNNSTGQMIPKQEEIIHPDWNKATDEYDIALVVLEYPADVETASIVSINGESSLPSDGSFVRTMGWGDTTMDDGIDKISDVLMAVDVEVISNNDCRQVKGTDGSHSENYANYIFPSMICTLTPGQDACQGDSGGPLIIPGEDSSQDVQIGVVSWGIGCARMFPGVYSRVSIAYDWIQETVCNVSTVPPEGLCYTKNPTIQPTTMDPSVSPTYTPTYLPSNQPTERPSVSPSITPMSPPSKGDALRAPEVDPDKRTADVENDSNSCNARQYVNVTMMSIFISILLVQYAR